jgi:hypothetical protein
LKELEAWAPAHAGLGTTGLSKPKQDPVLLLSISRRLYLSYGEKYTLQHTPQLHI